jgi:hypothetical protein
MNLSVIDLGLVESEQAWRLEEKYATEIEEMRLADLLKGPLEMSKIKKQIIFAFEQIFGFHIVPLGNLQSD